HAQHRILPEGNARDAPGYPRTRLYAGCLVVIRNLPADSRVRSAVVTDRNLPPVPSGRHVRNRRVCYPYRSVPGGKEPDFVVYKVGGKVRRATSCPDVTVCPALQFLGE